jgi:hypothetical protein
VLGGAAGAVEHDDDGGRGAGRHVQQRGLPFASALTAGLVVGWCWWRGACVVDTGTTG